MQHVRNKLAAERKSEHTQLRQPERALHYHVEWLSLADDYFELTQQFIINPRNLQASSLMEADVTWMRDCSRYQQLKRYFKDEDKRKKLAG